MKQAFWTSDIGSQYRESIRMNEPYMKSTNFLETPEPPTSTLAIVSLVSGILTWFLLPFIGAIVAIITGHMAKAEIRNAVGELSGDGFATAGLVLGYLQIVGVMVPICVIVILLLMGPTIGDIFSNIIMNI
jgi:hypothetical protein